MRKYTLVFLYFFYTNVYATCSGGTLPTVTFSTLTGDTICGSDTITVALGNMGAVDSFRIAVRRNNTPVYNLGNYYGQPSSFKFRSDTTDGMYNYIYIFQFWCGAGGPTASTLASMRDTFNVRYNYLTSLGGISITPTTGCGGDTIVVNNTALATGYWKDTITYRWLYYYGAPSPIVFSNTGSSLSFIADSFNTYQYLVRRSAVSSCGSYKPNVNFVADTININALATGYAELVNFDSILVKRVKLGYQYKVFRNNVLYFDTTYGSTPNPDSFFLQNVPSGTYRIEGHDPSSVCDRVIATVIRAIGLPVTFIDFAGYPEDDRVICNWSTASEKNTSHFLIQVATDQTIANNSFESVGKIPAVGNSASMQKYSWVHTLNEKYKYENILYYRLTSVDFDDLSEILKIIVIRRIPGENPWIPFSLDGKKTSVSRWEYHKYSGSLRFKE